MEDVIIYVQYQDNNIELTDITIDLGRYLGFPQIGCRSESIFMGVGELMVAFFRNTVTNYVVIV